MRPFAKVTDADIASSAVKAIELNDSIPTSKIHVTVKQGYVYLTGTVDWKFEKDAAAKAVAHLRGMLGVINNLDVKTRISSIVVKEKIEEALTRSAELDARRLIVETHDSTVDLWGNVKTWSEKREAERAAWASPGVTLVNSHLHIVP